ncbi:MAG: LysR family transcriptional regulator [Proteobacteria bacterium]|nr:LysR family transcriptional regulator [Pseudomonadota bacterium]
MTTPLTAGISVSRSFTVDKERTIDFMGEDARVYATPSLIRDIEQTCRDLIVEHLGEDEDSVGFKVSILHTAPTLLDMEVTITATIVEVDGGKVVLDVSAKDQLDEIASGKHERFVVNVTKTKQRLLAKAEKVASANPS